MTEDTRPLVRMDVTYKVHVEHEVTANVKATTNILRSDVALWCGIEEPDVTEQDVMRYVREFEDEYGDPLIDSSEFDLEDVVDWDSPTVRILATDKKQVVPPSFVPLFDLDAT